MRLSGVDHGMDAQMYGKAGGGSLASNHHLIALYPAILFSFSSLLLINIPLYLSIYSQWLTPLLRKLNNLRGICAILTVC